METSSPLESQKKKKRPKVKGCYECSRRRIDCDRVEPQCGKCQQKGLKCSGLGLRYRFSDGLPSRKKLVGDQKPIVNQERIPSTTVIDPSSSLAVRQFSNAQSQFDLLPPGRIFDYTSNVDDDENEDESFYNEIENISNELSIYKSIDHLDAATRSMLSYFSIYIAPTMAVIDERFNGYRDLVLPLAETECLVRKAVLAAATQHLSLKTGGLLRPQTKIYGEVLRGLLERSQSVARDLPRDEVSLVSIILLLLCEMITGGKNFSFLYAALKNFVRAGDEKFRFEQTPLGEFLKLQTYRFQLSAESLLSEHDGSVFVTIQMEQCLEFLRFCRSMHPEHSDPLSNLRDMIQQAGDIYVHRAINNPPLSATVPLVEKFKQTAERAGSQPIGHHILAWSYFIVAAESSHPDHRAFFLDRMDRLYRLTGFENYIKGVSQLKRIWNMQSTTRWTTLLGGPAQVLIM